MKAHKNREELLTTAISAVITLVGGIGLSILLNGFIRGFFALTAIGLVLFLIIAWRNSFPFELARPKDEGGSRAKDRDRP